MNTVSGGGRWLLIAALTLCAGREAGALILSLTATDMERALALARWPRPDADRIRFHQPYIVTLNRPPVDSWIVEQVEVITEFRRLELLAEEHEKLRDLWGKGGSFREVDESMRPFRGRLSIVARLGFRSNQPYGGEVPVADVVMDGPDVLTPTEMRRTTLYANCGGVVTGCPVVGGIVEAIFDAAAVGNRIRPVIVTLTSQELAHVSIDFSELE